MTCWACLAWRCIAVPVGCEKSIRPRNGGHGQEIAYVTVPTGGPARRPHVRERETERVTFMVMNGNVSSWSTTITLATMFTWAQRREPLARREQHRQGRGFFSERERAHLRFRHWPYQTDRLDP